VGNKDQLVLKFQSTSAEAVFCLVVQEFTVLLLHENGLRGGGVNYNTEMRSAESFKQFVEC